MLRWGTKQQLMSVNFPHWVIIFLRPQRAESGSRCKVCPQKGLISTQKGALELLELLNKEWASCRGPEFLLSAQGPLGRNMVAVAVEGKLLAVALEISLPLSVILECHRGSHSWQGGIHKWKLPQWLAYVDLENRTLIGLFRQPRNLEVLSDCSLSQGYWPWLWS